MVLLCGGPRVNPRYGMVDINISVETSDIIDGKTDDRGRLRLGPEYKNSDVEVAVLSVGEDANDDREAQPAD